jgi:methylamine dehydrogenase heavy chain
MYVLMHQGGANTQKQPGSEIWVYDVAAARVARYPLPELATAIAISGDAHPLLYTALFGSGTLVVRDPATGAVLRKITGVGATLR